MNIKALLLTCLCTPIIASETVTPAMLNQIANQKPMVLSPIEAGLIRAQLKTTLKPLLPIFLLASAHYTERDWRVADENLSNLIISPFKVHINNLHKARLTKEQVTLEKSRLELFKLYVPLIDKLIPHVLLENQASTNTIQHPKLAELAPKCSELTKPLTDLIPEYENAVTFAESKLATA